MAESTGAGVPSPVSLRAGRVARHDAFYGVLLAAVWCVYFLHDKLLRTRVGSVLIRGGRLLMVVAAAGFFGGIYWLILVSG